MDWFIESNLFAGLMACKPPCEYFWLLFSVGSVCNCILPEALQVSAVRHEPDHPIYDNEKRRLRSTFSCLSSISMRQRHLSTPSLFIPSPLRGCLPPWELRRSNNSSLKERWRKLFLTSILKFEISECHQPSSCHVLTKKKKKKMMVV